MSADVLQAVRDLLATRRHPEVQAMKRCDCAFCQSLRATPYVCELCGYDGEPAVWPCDCEETRQANIAWCEEGIADPTLSEKDRELRKECLPKYLAGPLPRCEPDTPTGCMHGKHCCPTCLHWTESHSDGSVECEQLAGLVRDLREILATESAS